MTTDRRAYLYALAPLVAVGLAAVLSAVDPTSVSLGALAVVGVVPIAAGVAVVAWAVHTFAEAGVTPSPAETPDRLVTDGPLAYTRNPLYLGTVLGSGGVAVSLSSPVAGGYAVLLALSYHGLVVYREEPTLRAVHGAAYDRYCSSVPRWL